MNKLVILSLAFFISSCSSLKLPSVLNITNSSLSEKQDESINIQNTWSTDIGNKRDYKTGVLQPYFIDGVAYTIDSHGLISAIKLSDGNTLWAASLDMNVSSGLTIHNKNIYFGTNDGMYHGYDLETLANSYSLFDSLNFIDFLDYNALESTMSVQLKSEASSPSIGVDDLIIIKLDDGDTSAINIKNSNI